MAVCLFKLRFNGPVNSCSVMSSSASERRREKKKE